MSRQWKLTVEAVPAALWPARVSIPLAKDATPVTQFSVQRPDGSRGFFHPDNFTFGDPVRVSAIYAAAQAVAGVRRVEVRALRRQGATTGPDVPVNGVFTTGRLEIVRLENNPDFSDHGILKLQLRGGR